MLSGRSLFLVLSALTASHLFIAVLSETTLPVRTHRVASPLSGRGRGRGLFQRTAASNVEAAGMCRWNEAESRCEVSLATSAQHLRDSGNDFAQFIAQFTECAAIGNEATCRSTSTCIWNVNEERCLFADFVSGRENSPCVVDAPNYMMSLVINDTCSAYGTQLPCVRDPNCFWDFEDPFCNSNDFRLYFGLHDFELGEALIQVINNKLEVLREELQSEFDTDDPDFDWETVLDWDFPGTDCPAWSDPLVCSMADIMMHNITTTRLYCNGRYEATQYEDCVLDPLCTFDFSRFTCENLEGFGLSMFEEAILDVLVPTIEEPIDREIMNVDFGCDTISEEEQCTGECSWCPVDEACYMRSGWLATTLAAPGIGGDDAVCLYARAFAESNCLDIMDLPDGCTANPNCTFVEPTDPECLPSLDYFISFAISQNSALENSYRPLQDECSAHSTREECINT